MKEIVTDFQELSELEFVNQTLVVNQTEEPIQHVRMAKVILLSEDQFNASPEVNECESRPFFRDTMMVC